MLFLGIVHQSSTICLYHSVCLCAKLSRLPNCASSFNAANAAAATGGTKTASLHSMAAIPSSSRR